MSSDPDPFAKVVYSTGISIDLTGTEEELAAAWLKLGRIEDRLARTGMTCELKDGGQDCLTCPMATLDPDEPRSMLCRLGKDQRTVEERCMEKTEARLAPYEEIGERVGPAVELVSDAGPPDELAELLTAVGL